MQDLLCSLKGRCYLCYPATKYDFFCIKIGTTNAAKIWAEAKECQKEYIHYTKLYYMICLLLKEKK